MLYEVITFLQFLFFLDRLRYRILKHLGEVERLPPLFHFFMQHVGRRAVARLPAGRGGGRPPGGAARASEL